MRKIGALLTIGKPEDIDAEFDKLVKMELSSCQICSWNKELYTPENAAAINAATKKYGITVSSFWAGWAGPCEWNFNMGPSTIGLVPAAYRLERLSELMLASEFALSINVKNVVTHVGFLPENPADPDFVGTVGALRKLCRVLKERGQNFLFETGQETPVTMLRTIQAIGLDNVGINFDTANLILYGKANPVDALDVFGKYVMDTHIKDGLYPTDGMSLGKETPVGEGKANIPAIIAKLDSLGYDGAFTIEREISGDEQIRDIAATRDLLKKYL